LTLLAPDRCENLFVEGPGHLTAGTDWTGIDTYLARPFLASYAALEAFEAALRRFLPTTAEEGLKGIVLLTLRRAGGSGYLIGAATYCVLYQGTGAQWSYDRGLD
jgi:hypothetical protein